MAPEAVPLILKTVFSHTPLSNVQMFLENSLDRDDSSNPVNDEENNLQSNNVTQLSKVEFRFF